MNDTKLANLTRVDVTGTGLVLGDALQSNAENCGYYRSVEVWNDDKTRRHYRVTILRTSERVHSGFAQYAKVELWAAGWTEVLTLDRNDAAIITLPTPKEAYSRVIPSLERIEDASFNLAQSAAAILR